MTYMESLGKKARAAEKALKHIGTAQKNAALRRIAAAFGEHSREILEANQRDITAARENGLAEAFIERLTLTQERLAGISAGLCEVAALPDPVGEIIGGGTTEKGLNIIKTRVPLGVIGIIFESRPNVTADAAALCLKSGNACILRGGSDALLSNICLVRLMGAALEESGIPPEAVQLVEDVSRETAAEMMKLDRYIDVLIPRGGRGLIRSVTREATVPVIQTGEGNCHIYIDEHADIATAVRVAENAKTSRPSVCNAVETILVHKKIAPAFWGELGALWAGRVKIFGDSETARFTTVEREATEEDYSTEYNDMKIAARVVESLDEAIEHITRYGTRHSEAIITESLHSAEKFQQEVDAAAVYVNTSTRFTDGYEFGLGAEIGISNQKLHARGPMGLRELTTCKYLISSSGQIR